MIVIMMVWSANKNVKTSTVMYRGFYIFRKIQNNLYKKKIKNGIVNEGFT